MITYLSDIKNTIPSRHLPASMLLPVRAQLSLGSTTDFRVRQFTARHFCLQNEGLEQNLSDKNIASGMRILQHPESTG